MSRDIVKVFLNQILEDTAFNCRGKINPQSCIDLARSIKTDGLLSPVQLTLLDSPGPNGEVYGMICGHRRLMAHKINKSETIEAEILPKMSPSKAILINLKENIDRTDLTLMQEARAIEKLRMINRMSAADLCTELNRSQPWVKVRLAALDLEPMIQEEITKSSLTAKHILTLTELPPGQARYDFIKKVKTARLTGEKPRVAVGKKTPFAKRARIRTEIFELQDHIIDSLGGGDVKKLPTEAMIMIQALGWCAGEATDMDVFSTLRQIADRNGLQYAIPENFMSALQGK